jgi:hypothetical protein
MIFIVSSYFTEVLGNEDVELEMPNFFWKVWKNWKNLFLEHRAKKSKIVNKISSKPEVLKRKGVKLVFLL